MAIIIILIAISLSIAVFFLAIFYWNMKSGQYDDTCTPAIRILFDNRPAGKSSNQPDAARDKDLKKNSATAP